jgi:signal transduction histidine kinase
MSVTVALHAPASPPEAGGERVSRVTGRLNQLRDPLIVFAVVLGSALGGILLQPHGLLSSFWFANAILLGTMLRRPGMATSSGWAAAVAGFLVADLTMGSGLLRTGLLTLGNMAGIAVAFVMFRRLTPDMLALRSAFAPLVLTVITLTGSMAAGLVGMWANPLLFNGSPQEGFLFWTVSEFTNYMAILPLTLTATMSLTALTPAGRVEIDMVKIAPALACIMGAILALVMPGSGSVLFPMPGLIWCALTYNVGSVAAMSGLVAAWMLVAPAMGWIEAGILLETPAQTLNFRLGIALALLGPISIASVMSARRESLREAAAARRASEEAMGSRTLLLATMTHELRTPLNIIAGYAHLIEHPMRNATQNDQTEHAQRIYEAAVHMNELVTDLLDTAKVEAGQFKLALAPTDSRATMDQSVRLVVGMAMERKISIKVEPGYWPHVQADARAIKQVMINLLSNAIRYSPDGATIRVTSKLMDGRLAVSVADKGSGIAPEDLNRLGRAYQQAGDPSQQRQGTGLGLALSISLIAQHGGTLKLQSELGRGTTATFDLRLLDMEAANDD